MRFINYGTKDGLADKFIYSIAQDKKGYMWFGTGSGLYRYDRHSFKIFRSNIDKPGRTISNVLQSVHCDNNNNLWLGAFNTLQWYNPEKNIFWQPNFSNEENRKLADAYISNITDDAGGNTWIATNRDYFFQFNKKDSSFISYRKNYPAAASKNTLKIISLNAGIFAVHNEGIYEFDNRQNFIAAYPFKEGGIANAAADGETIWLTSLQNGIVKFDTKEKKYTVLENENNNLQKNNLNCLIKDTHQNLWIGSYPLFKVSMPKTAIKIYGTQLNNEYSLAASKISVLFTDREQNLWIGSFNGLSMLPWQNRQIKKIPLTDAVSGNTVEPAGVFELPGTKDLLIANTNSGGLVYYDAAQNKNSTIVNPFFTSAEQKKISAVVTDNEKNIYASDAVNFFKLQIQKKELYPFLLKDQDGKPIINAGRNVCDSKGNIYISSVNNGFYNWDKTANKLTHYNKWDVDKTAAINDDNVFYPCLVDDKDNIWFTSNSSVYKYTTAENKFYHHAFTENKNVPQITAANYITQDKMGHYWISTLNNGLYELYFEKDKEILKNYTINSGIGLPSDYILNIKPDIKDSTLWISTNQRLLKFDPIAKRVLSIFKKQNGLEDDPVSYPFTITSANQLVQSFYGMLDIIDLNTYQFNTNKPSISFNAVKVLNEDYLHQIDWQNPLLTLADNENFIQFEFAALLYNNSNQTQYAYYLEGLENNWIYTDNKNTVSYSGLKPGTYIFKVKAANNDGVWGNEATLKIIITPPFYQRWWFIGLCLFVVGTTVYGWNRYRISQVKKEEKLKATFQQQIAITEMKALRAQMNPHFIFNSLNGIQKYILKNDQFAASQYLTKFSRLIRLILDHSNQNTILLSSELDLLKLYIEMESMRFDERFDYTITIDKNINAETVAIPSMLIQPYIENAIWHGLLHKEEKGMLTVSFSLDEKNDLKVMIEDNGVGRQKAAELKSKQVLKKKSFCIQITEYRISIINRTMNINATSEIIDLKNEQQPAQEWCCISHYKISIQ